MGIREKIILVVTAALKNAACVSTSSRPLRDEGRGEANTFSS